MAVDQTETCAIVVESKATLQRIVRIKNLLVTIVERLDTLFVTAHLPRSPEHPQDTAMVVPLFATIVEVCRLSSSFTSLSLSLSLSLARSESVY
jgi:hypothetical protein